ncbi:MAG: SDR family NAD(P)-dependent oxidoreductase [Caulobacterales bacterium]
MFKEKYGPWALIAGGSDGIGAAFSREAAARGLNIIIVARRQGPLDELATEIRKEFPNIEVRTHSIDLGEESAIEKLKAITADVEIGSLIYNAGAEPKYGDFLDHDWELLHGRLERNFVVKAAMVHHFGRIMRDRKRGGIVLMGSIAGYAGSPGFAFYASSKAYTHTLSEGLWFEFKKHNVDLVCPVVGFSATPTMVNSYGPIEGPTTDPAFIAKGALDRIADGPMWIADDIAEMIKGVINLEPATRAAAVAQQAKAFAKAH